MSAPPDSFKFQPKRPMTVREALEDVAAEFGLTLEELLEKELISLEITRFNWRSRRTA